MSVYGDLSKAQRALLTDLWRHRLQDLNRNSRVDRHGHFYLAGKRRQTAANLERLGFVVVEGPAYSWSVPVSLSDAGIALMKSLNFSHARGCRR